MPRLNVGSKWRCTSVGESCNPGKWDPPDAIHAKIASASASKRFSAADLRLSWTDAQPLGQKREDHAGIYQVHSEEAERLASCSRYPAAGLRAFAPAGPWGGSWRKCRYVHNTKKDFTGWWVNTPFREMIARPRVSLCQWKLSSSSWLWCCYSAAAAYSTADDANLRTPR
jgi:hypothetical protein